jgi:hypothetical protein
MQPKPTLASPCCFVLLLLACCMVAGVKHGPSTSTAACAARTCQGLLLLLLVEACDLLLQGCQAGCQVGQGGTRHTRVTINHLRQTPAGQGHGVLPAVTGE